MTVRIFIACSPREWLPARVLEFSIRERTGLAVELSTISDCGRAIPMPRDVRNRPRTPFSFQRFLIPELCDWKGKAIYLDADMQVFVDIRELWEAPMDAHDLLTVREGTAGRRGQFSVMLLDCERLQWRVESIVAGLDKGSFTYEQLMYDMCVAANVGRTLDPAWNSLEHYERGVTRLVHYTDMDTQPWTSLDNQLQQLWVDCLRRAISAGFIQLDQVRSEIRQGNVRPSLEAELSGGTTARDLPRLDAGYRAPYTAIRSGSASPWVSWHKKAAAVAQRGLKKLKKSLQA